MSKRITLRAVVKTSGPATVRISASASTSEAPRKALVFGKGNAKLKGVDTFSLPAGWSCPGASECLSKSNRETGKLKDGPETQFRCFSASQEAMYPSVRKARWRNLDALRGLTVEEMAELIESNLPRKARTVRIHVSGDFYSQDYFDAWLAAAARRPDVLFYFYTKSLRFWVTRLADVGNGYTPGRVANFVPTASKGGKDDALISAHGLRSAVVVYSERQAAEQGLDIDDDDTHAMAHGADFALLIHGMQPPGSLASKALSALRARGEFGYGEKADARRQALPVLN